MAAPTPRTTIPDHRVSTAFTLDDDALVSWKVQVRNAVEQTRTHDEGDAVAEGRVSALGALGGTITTRVSHLGDEFEADRPVAVCRG
ncbi:MAG: hypothetical protein M3237_03315 [Actinomycetota bacterium]|nr:hypothetical protein [Actinomycetota bacterium]